MTSSWLPIVRLITFGMAALCSHPTHDRPTPQRLNLLVHRCGVGMAVGNHATWTETQSLSILIEILACDFGASEICGEMRSITTFTFPLRIQLRVGMDILPLLVLATDSWKTGWRDATLLYPPAKTIGRAALLAMATISQAHLLPMRHSLSASISYTCSGVTCQPLILHPT
ncbi:hypothetical protein BC826DRAFT_328477 [Russula brevipes]|nr:hypothetical protein BC826DRAFT_328477 [Russula brevipes]